MLVATLAAAVVVPCSALACSAKTVDTDCCCQAREQASAETSSCRHHSESPEYCAIKTCDCCRPAAPQNIPPDRTTARVQPDFAVAVSNVAGFHGGAEFASAIEAARDGHLTAIPHRILHCSWLI